MGVFVKFPSNSRTIAAIAVFVILIAIPLTVIIAQQQQELRQRAAVPDAACSSTDNALPDCSPKPQLASICNEEPGYRCKASVNEDEDTYYQIYECSQ